MSTLIVATHKSCFNNTDVVAGRLKSLCEEIGVGQKATHAYVFATMTEILLGTKWSRFVEFVPKCNTADTLQKFVYETYLCVLGLSQSRLKIKSRGQYRFQTEKDEQAQRSAKKFARPLMLAPTYFNEEV